MTRQILAMMFHPRLDRSTVTRRLFYTLQQDPGIVAVDMYASYPDFGIDVEFEKKRIQAHNIIVFLYPIYWYSGPALLKEWMDLVLEYGFAYGMSAAALKGKYWLPIVSCGTDEESYTPTGSHEHTLETFLLPYAMTAKVCQMQYQKPIAIYGLSHSQSESKIKTHINQVMDYLQTLKENVQSD